MSPPRSPGKTPLARRFLVSYAVVYIVLIGAMSWFIVLSVERTLTQANVDRMETAARLAVEGMPDDPALLGPWVERIFAVTGNRATVIAPDGTVLADSHQNPEVMENHGSRPEVVAAVGGGVGEAVRVSRSTGFEQRYVAVAAEDGTVVRLSSRTGAVGAELAPLVESITLIALLVGVIGIGIVAVLAGYLARPIASLTDQTLELANGRSVAGIRRSSVTEIDQLGQAIARLQQDKEERLLEAERAGSTLEVVLGALPEGTLLLDESDRVVYSNPAAARLLGAVPEMLAGLTPYPFQTAVRACRQGGAPTSVTAEHGKPVRVLRGIATPFEEDERVLLVVADVTERERAASVRRDFVANASHELKTPVSSIIASAEALRIALGRRDESAGRFAGQIERSARQLDRLVTDLLDLSRLEREQPELDPLRLDLLVAEETERMGPTAVEAGVTIGVETEPVRVAGSRRDVAIAVRNLLDNAVRHTPEGGSVAVALHLVDGEAVLEVRDTGEGIPTRDLARVFERFYRVDSARSRATGGTGLGLAIVKHVVESHGGSVEVDSELGAGSVFVIRLPALVGDNPTARLA